MLKSHLMYTGAVIGFDHNSNIYEVSEGTNRFVDITVKVLEGQLERDVVVQFDTVNGTAVSSKCAHS